MARPRWGHTKDGQPVHAHVTDHLPVDHPNRIVRFNAKFAIICTALVGSMWCAYLFALLAVAGLPTALKPGNIGLLFWISSDFLQLTLLSVIIVGQNIGAKASDARAAKTFEDTEEIADRLDMDTQGGLTDLYDRLHAEIRELHHGH